MKATPLSLDVIIQRRNRRMITSAWEQEQEQEDEQASLPVPPGETPDPLIYTANWTLKPV